MPRTRLNTNKEINNIDKDTENREFLRELEIEAESSINLLKAEHEKAMKEIDQQFESLKRSVPDFVLKMPLKDLRRYNTFDEITAEQNIIDLNVTIHNKVKKADYGHLRTNPQIMFPGIARRLNLNYLSDFEKN